MDKIGLCPFKKERERERERNDDKLLKVCILWIYYHLNKNFEEKEIKKIYWYKKKCMSAYTHKSKKLF